MRSPIVGDHYVLATGEAGAKRLALLQQIVGPCTERILVRAGIATGMKVADIGCGTGTVSRWMSKAVGPNGHVIAMDASPASLEVARKETLSASIANIEFVEGNVYEPPLQKGSLDLVFCRLLLCHLTKPLEGLKALRELLKPGGILVCQDLDAMSALSMPATPVYARINELCTRLGTLRGVDYNLGLKLHELFHDAGLMSEHIDFYQPVVLDRDEKRWWEYTFLEALPVMLEAGVLVPAEAAEISKELEKIAMDDGIAIAQPRITSVWAKRK